jgi:DNA polymerase III subunit beta
MKCTFKREQLLGPLQAVIGAVEKKQTMPILSNILFRSNGGHIHLVGTDLEIELVAETEIVAKEKIDVTLPARKLLDICKNLGEDADLQLSFTQDRATLTSGSSRFVLASLPAADFPVLEGIRFDSTVAIAAGTLKSLIERTSFAMAQQDVRYYLNGLLLEYRGNSVRTVATDGHRLALSNSPVEGKAEESRQVIIPRKGVLELQRLLADGETTVELAFSGNHVRLQLPGIRFTSKLIDGRFPDYERVMPVDGNRELAVDKQLLRQSLTRASILSSEKHRGVRLVLAKGLLKLQTQNPDKEEAEEQLQVDYDAGDMEIAFNVTYLLDVLNVLRADMAKITFKDANSSCVIYEDKSDSRYVVMPMRL